MSTHRNNFIVLFAVVGVLVALVIISYGVIQWEKSSNLKAGDFVPQDTLAFVRVPDGTLLIDQFKKSAFGKISDTTEFQSCLTTFGIKMDPAQKDLFQTVATNLSGESFLAVTHFASGAPDDYGFLLGMKPLPQGNTLGSVWQKMQQLYPETKDETTTGWGMLEGLPYAWMQGTDSPKKIYLLQAGGWIFIVAGEAELQDLASRYAGKSSTPSLARNQKYQEALQQQSPHSVLLTYLNLNQILFLAHLNESSFPGQGDLFELIHQNKMPEITLGLGFNDQNLTDRMALLWPKENRAGLGKIQETSDCHFLKNTGAETVLFLDGKIDAQLSWNRLIKSMQASLQLAMFLPFVEMITEKLGFNLKANLIDALGSDLAFITDWKGDEANPSFAIMIQVEHPEKLTPLAKALNDYKDAQNPEGKSPWRRVQVQGYNLFVYQQSRMAEVAPTLLMEGNELGLFSSEQEADRCLGRNEGQTLGNDPRFKQLLGQKVGRCSSLTFMDTPRVLNLIWEHYLPLIKQQVTQYPQLKGSFSVEALPANLDFMAPVGCWTTSQTWNDQGAVMESTSGVGNQGLFLVAGWGAFYYLINPDFARTFLPSTPFHPTPPPLFPKQPLAEPTHDADVKTSH